VHQHGAARGRRAVDEGARRIEEAADVLLLHVAQRAAQAPARTCPHTSQKPGA
jgi:hypothetical protein